MYIYLSCRVIVLSFNNTRLIIQVGKSTFQLLGYVSK